MDLTLHYLNSTVQGNIDLPSSKSISNRLLIIRALSGEDFPLNNLSESDDTRVMLEAFRNEEPQVNIGHAGTSMRFLTAFYAATAQEKIITGSERMRNRPIKALVDGLNQLGAGIEYAGKEGFPPVKTSGKPLTGNNLSIPGNISSQYITALLLIAPVLPAGLILHIEGELISSSYVKLTLGLMEQFGISYRREGNTIIIPSQKYRGKPFTVEGDWSGVSYWYEIAALMPHADLFIQGLQQQSLQGDAAIAAWFRNLGVSTDYLQDGIRLTHIPVRDSRFEADMINSPDLIQTFVVTLCLAGIPFRISGANTLRIKETDRILALQNEMKKLGCIIEEPVPGVLTWSGKTLAPEENIVIETYKDHRMAMAFAPAAIKFPGLTIRDALVVTKSYPAFWDHLKSAGFIINTIQ